MTITIYHLLLFSWLVGAVSMLAAWALQRATQNATIVDVAWCASYVLVAFGYASVVPGDPTRRLVLAALAGLWGARLAGYLYADRFHNTPEDARYRSFRERWGTRAHLYFFLLFQGEALVLPIMSLPLLVLMHNAQPTFSWWEWAGVLLFLVSIIGEWVADLQLAHFRANPANQGKTCRQGLWRYSRHPNYFFESLHWWAYVLMSVGVPYGWVTLVGPIAMTIALLKITGIPLTEAQAVAARGEDYRDYQRTTSAFIPWFPKK